MSETLAFLRKLNAQELGFRKSESGKAGRYILISKNCLQYFPPLSTVITNDHLFISLVEPRSGRVVLCKFVYHNDKITENKKNGRDEFRIYLNGDIDPGGKTFQPDDILIFFRTFIRQDLVYRLFHFPAKGKDSKYLVLDKLIQESGGRGAHALIPIEKIRFVNFEEELHLKEKIIPKEVREDAFKEPVQADVQQEDRETTTRIIRSTSFRDLVLFFYNYKCAITKEVIKYQNLMNLEAAHIIPRFMGGGNNPSNGLSLNRDLHWAFDKGFFTVGTDYVVKVHSEVSRESPLRAIHERQIHLPEDSRATPNCESLKWHNNKVFGIFKKSSDV